jgi:hypothetical protein
MLTRTRGWLTPRVADQPASRIDQLLPWKWQPARQPQTA